MIAAILKISKTPLLLRADSKGGVFDIRGISVDDYQFVVWQIIPDGMSEADGLTVIDRRNVIDKYYSTAISSRPILCRPSTIRRRCSGRGFLMLLVHSRSELHYNFCRTKIHLQ